MSNSQKRCSTSLFRSIILSEGSSLLAQQIFNVSNHEIDSLSWPSHWALVPGSLLSWGNIASNILPDEIAARITRSQKTSSSISVRAQPCGFQEEDTYNGYYNVSRTSLRYAFLMRMRLPKC